jgi:hypothetical protein
MADKKPEIDQAELDVAFRTIRQIADESNFARFISDDECKQWALRMVEAIEGYKAGDVL